MTFIIAEAGVNHNGSVDLAQRLVDAASVCGAHAVKFQTFDAEKLEPPGPRREMLRKLQLSKADHKRIAEHADFMKIGFMSTPFDVESLQFLLELGVPVIKIASGNLYNDPLLRAAADSGRDVILSTGGSSQEDVRRAVRFMNMPANRLVLLHCVSSYPAPLEETNLRVIQAMQQEFNNPIGLSDHTTSTLIPAVAAALGAVWIEKHLTLDKRMEGPDHLASLEPEQFEEMVRNIQMVQQALGDGIKRPMPSEEKTLKIIEERIAWSRSV